MLLAGTLNGAQSDVLVNVILQDCPHKHQMVHSDICELPSNLEDMQNEPDDLTQPMMTLWVQSYLFTLHWVLYETVASQDLGVAPHNLTMVPGEAIPTEAHGAAPFKPRRTTRPHTRPQGVGQNIYDTYRPAFL